MMPGEQPSEFLAGLAAPLKKCFEAYGCGNYNDFIGSKYCDQYPWYPLWSWSNGVSNDTPGGIAWQKMGEVKHLWLPKVVMSSDFEADWAAYQEAYNEVNPQAFLDEAQADIQMKSVIRRADAVVCIITDTLQPDAYALTKTMLRLGRKSETKIALCVYETDSNYVYFLGNDTTRCQKMIAETIMSTYIPYDDKFKSADKLPFQLELENELENYTLNDFKDGKYNY